MSLFDSRDWSDMSFPERVAIKTMSERSFLNFTRIWFELMQGESLLVNWHHRYAANEVDKVVRGGNSSQSLAICFPPGGTKSEFMSIHLPAYTSMLVQNGTLPKFRNLNLSFADSLVKRNSRRTRDIISSKEYQELWSCSFGVNKAEEWQIVDSKGKVKGETVSRAMGGQITGGRGGYFGDEFTGAVSLDDPAKPEDMFSSVKREAGNRKLNNTVRSRRGDKSKDHPTPFFLIMQRLHKDDPVGFCLSGGMGVEFKPIIIPALIDRDYLETLSEEVMEDCWNAIKDSPSRTVGGVEYWSYWPEMEDIDQLIDLWERDEYTFWSQYMQKPIAMSGGLIDTDWFGRYKQLPFIVSTAVFVDTNSGKVKDRLDYTVFTYVGLGDDGNLYVLDVSRGRWDPADLLVEAERLWDKWSNCWPVENNIPPREMYIEDKQAGQGLITTLQKKRFIPVNPVQRGEQQNKFVRHSNCQPQIKTGKVFIPSTYDENGDIEKTIMFNGQDGFSTEWVLPFLAECDSLTVGVLMDQETGYDDQYDTLMDAIDNMLVSGANNNALSHMFNR